MGVWEKSGSSFTPIHLWSFVFDQDWLIFLWVFIIFDFFVILISFWFWKHPLVESGWNLRFAQMILFLWYFGWNFLSLLLGCLDNKMFDVIFHIHYVQVFQFIILLLHLLKLQFHGYVRIWRWQNLHLLLDLLRNFDLYHWVIHGMEDVWIQLREVLALVTEIVVLANQAWKSASDDGTDSTVVTKSTFMNNHRRLLYFIWLQRWRSGLLVENVLHGSLKTFGNIILHLLGHQILNGCLWNPLLFVSGFHHPLLEHLFISKKVLNWANFFAFHVGVDIGGWVHSVYIQKSHQFICFFIWWGEAIYLIQFHRWYLLRDDNLYLRVLVLLLPFVEHDQILIILNFDILCILKVSHFELCHLSYLPQLIGDQLSQIWISLWIFLKNLTVYLFCVKITIICSHQKLQLDFLLFVIFKTLKLLCSILKQLFLWSLNSGAFRHIFFIFIQIHVCLCFYWKNVL